MADWSGPLEFVLTGWYLEAALCLITVAVIAVTVMRYEDQQRTEDKDDE